MQTTRLEAVMFTDIAGYSRLMDEDEERTINLLKRHNEIVLPVIESASGDVIDSIGDGLLVVFPSVRKAVACAVSIQEAIGAHNGSAGADQQFKLRIGIHLGEIWHEDDRVFGTGINIAARVQPFAPPGGICITEDVHRQIERKTDKSIVSIGVQNLKNITRPYELYQVVTGLEDHDDQTPATPAMPAKPVGELDEIKERVLAEIAKFSERHNSKGSGNAPDDVEHRVESKVYGIVERVMDHALDKWETMPDEKKAKIVKSVKVEIDSAGKKEKDDKNSSIAGEIAWGAAATAGFGIWYWFAGSTWMIVVGALVGVVPLFSGLGKLIKRWVRNRTDRVRRPALLEREVVAAARDLGGRVTVVQMAAHTGHSLDEIQTTLDMMTSKGYVSQQVLETGVIRYDFPSLISEETNSDPIT
jgi:class 3 adenylate cyclase